MMDLDIVTGIVVRRWASPCGVLLLGSVGHQLCLCDWEERKHRLRVDRKLTTALKMEYRKGTSEVIAHTIAELDAYFAGSLHDFSVPTLQVGTEFQQRVWRQLQQIPYGATTTYAQIADAIGQPQAVRAVANAIGANPISIIVPCHRVVGANNSLTGYAGGITAKRTLLQIESKKSCHLMSLMSLKELK
ncbi:MAG: methylated-DNA--[protein]-cysteine S-methyltransferase [Sodaliphilus sp.]